MNKKLQESLLKIAPNILLAKPGDPYPFAMFGIECGDGWYTLLLKLLMGLEAELEKLGPEAKGRIYVEQIKEKWGGLRCYLSCSTEPMERLIRKAEEESFKTCEDCGAIGKLRNYNGWRYVACDECEDGRFGGGK